VDDLYHRRAPCLRDYNDYNNDYRLGGNDAYLSHLDL
jgi:hypothetical protein